MFKVLKDSDLRNRAAYTIILIFFIIIAFLYKSTAWKLFSVGLIISALAYLVFSFLVSKKLASISNAPDFECIKKRLVTWEKIISFVPITIILYVGAIYSLVYPGAFLPGYISVILLVLPAGCILSEYISKLEAGKKDN